MDQGWLITVIMNGLKPNLSAEVIKADPQTLEDLTNVAARAEMTELRRTTTPALQESTNLALLNDLQEIREDLRPIPSMHLISSLIDVLESRGYQIMAIIRYILRATSPLLGSSIHHSNGNNHTLPGIGSNPSGTKHNHPLAHVLDPTDRPSPTTWRVSFVILYITMYRRISVFIVDNFVIFRKIAHTDKLLPIHNTTPPPPPTTNLHTQPILVTTFGVRACLWKLF